MRQLKFKFCSPPISGAYYDPASKTAYFFTLNITETQKQGFKDDIEQAIIHETIHYTIQKIAGKKASTRFDKLSKKVHDKWNEIYSELY